MPTVLPVLQSGVPYDETVILIAGAVFAGVGIWYLGVRLQARIHPGTAELVRAGLLVLLAGLVAVVLIRQWNASENPLRIVGAIEFGVNTAVRILLTVVLFVAAHAVTRILKRLLAAEGRSIRPEVRDGDTEPGIHPVP